MLLLLLTIIRRKTRIEAEICLGRPDAHSRGGIHMPKLTEFTFTSTNGRTEIHVRRWDPDSSARGIVQIAHGIAEHAERYDGFMEFLAGNGFIASANDHLGHGGSVTDESELGFFAEHGGWDLAVGDMHKLHDILFTANPTLPFFLFGHSMGSFLARTYIIRYPSELTGAVICGTGQQPPALVGAGSAMARLICSVCGPKHKSGLLNRMAFGKYNSKFVPVRTMFDWLSRDAANVDRYMKDPLCGFVPSASMFRDMMGGIAFISSSDNIGKMRKDLPVLFIAGDKDPVGEDGEGVRRACAAFQDAGMEDIKLILYPECRHELLNELNRDEVMADVLAWMDSKIPE